MSEEDELAAARGCITAIGYSLIVYGLLGLAIWLVME